MPLIYYKLCGNTKAILIWPALLDLTVNPFECHWKFYLPRNSRNNLSNFVALALVISFMFGVDFYRVLLTVQSHHGHCKMAIDEYDSGFFVGLFCFFFNNIVFLLPYPKADERRLITNRRDVILAHITRALCISQTHVLELFQDH